jgi:hypothetical protein
MALPRFPELPGVTWPMQRTTIAGATLVFAAASGRTARGRRWQRPLYKWTLPYEALASDEDFPGLYAHSKQILEGFFLQQGGRDLPFIYRDPTDCYEQGSAIGLGDGATVTFAAMRTLGGYAEPVDAILNIGAVYLSGVAQTAPGAWNVTAPNGVDANAITFATPPASGAVITTDVWYGFKCNFSTDDIVLKNFAKGLHSLDALEFERVRTS